MTRQLYHTRRDAAGNGYKNFQLRPEDVRALHLEVTSE